MSDATGEMVTATYVTSTYVSDVCLDCEIEMPTFLTLSTLTCDFSTYNSQSIFFLSFFHSALHCCVHNMSPFISSSGLSPGSHEAEVQWAPVCLNCTEPSVTRSSYYHFQ